MNCSITVHLNELTEAEVYAYVHKRCYTCTSGTMTEQQAEELQAVWVCASSVETWLQSRDTVKAAVMKYLGRQTGRQGVLVA